MSIETFDHNIKLNASHNATNHLSQVKELSQIYNNFKKLLSIIMRKNCSILDDGADRPILIKQRMTDDISTYISTTLSKFKHDMKGFSDYIYTFIKMLRFGEFADESRITEETIDRGFDKMAKYKFFLLLTVKIKFSEVWVFMDNENKPNFIECLNKIWYWGNMYIKKYKIMSHLVSIPNENDKVKYGYAYVMKTTTPPTSPITYRDCLMGKYESLSNMHKFIVDIIFNTGCDFENQYLPPPEKIIIPCIIFPTHLQGKSETVKLIIDETIDKNKVLDDHDYRTSVIATSHDVVDSIINIMVKNNITNDTDIGMSMSADMKNTIIDSKAMIERKIKDKSVKPGELTDIALSMLKIYGTTDKETIESTSGPSRESAILINTLISAMSESMRKSRNKDPNAGRILKQLKEQFGNSNLPVNQELKRKMMSQNVKKVMRRK